MNPLAKKFNQHQCAVCGYPFSDAHHMYPRAKGGKETIYLCPNHHRFANMLQIIIDQNGFHGVSRAEQYALDHFDAAFNEKVLQHLIGEHLGAAHDIADDEEMGIERPLPKKRKKKEEPNYYGIKIYARA